jgi:hypothetical protein
MKVEQIVSVSVIYHFHMPYGPTISDEIDDACEIQKASHSRGHAELSRVLGLRV